MSQKLYRTARKYVKNTMKTDINDLIVFMRKQGFWVRWNCALHILWGIKFEIKDEMIEKADAVVDGAIKEIMNDGKA